MVLSFSTIRAVVLLSINLFVFAFKADHEAGAKPTPYLLGRRIPKLRKKHSHDDAPVPAEKGPRASRTAERDDAVEESAASRPHLAVGVRGDVLEQSSLFSKELASVSSLKTTPKKDSIGAESRFSSLRSSDKPDKAVPGPDGRAVEQPYGADDNIATLAARDVNVRLHPAHQRPVTPAVPSRMHTRGDNFVLRFLFLNILICVVAGLKFLRHETGGKHARELLTDFVGDVAWLDNRFDRRSVAKRMDWRG